MTTTTVLQLSDTHLPVTPGPSGYGPDADVRLATVLEAWAATGETADLVLLTGDLADDGSRQGCERLAAAVSALGGPVLAIPGNHDRPEVVATTWGAPPVAAVGAWRVVGIDTTIPGEVHGTVDVAAAMALVDATSPHPTLLALHHPPISRSTHDQFRLLGASDLLAALVDRPHVRALVAGHLHDAADLEADTGLAVLGAPSTLMALTHDGPDMEIAPDAPTGARVLRLADDGTFTSTILEA